MTRITFLGTGDAMGVPRAYCDCKVCEEARASGVNRRLRSSLLIHDQKSGDTFIDCGPDWGRQMELAGLRSLDRILITHAHFDHIGGMVEWADACRWQGRRGQVYAPEKVIKEICNRFPWLGNHLEFHSLAASLQIGEWRVQSWEVNHGKNGFSFAFRFDHEKTQEAWAYCSDAIALTEEQLAPLYGLDLLILGTSFYKENFPFETRSVYDVTEAIGLLETLSPKQAVFTHLSHDIDLRTKYSLPEHTSFATTGMSLNFS
ncbi:MBL fold metallo-hydrolase [Paenibacillus abyssi]|uniref:MBL fold metallo-hydrolase n=1 Tax=Paenibacillus abyssi TaxID=1340531 RepID=A0A917CJ28_9BACL|nr:MBL fold metallo-hydrolase [Paenibacillus abyssi]GGF89940.1 MBL fold metallo-hydrolase [Paenibacillus abyssi]